MEVPLNPGNDSEGGSPSPHEDGLVRYLREVERTRLLTRSEERTLLDRSRAGDRRALNELVTHNLKWVVAVSAEFKDRGLPMSDLIAEGNLGLIRAALSFDPSHGFRFSGFAIWWIRQALEKALRFGRPPPVSEPPNPTSPSALPASLPLQPAGPEPPGLGSNSPWASRLSPEIRRTLGALTEPGRTVLKLFFGLDTPKPMSLEAISRVLGVDPGRAGQIRDQALRQLQKAVPEPGRDAYRDPRPAFHP
jgi:RNA polymerase sigma factor (sigma-70 family)